MIDAMQNKYKGLKAIEKFLFCSYCQRNNQKLSLPIIKEGTCRIVNNTSNNKIIALKPRNIGKVIFNQDQKI